MVTVVIDLKNVDGVLGLHDLADGFDYACSKARAEAIDGLLIATLEERGLSLQDDDVLERVRVEHEGKTRARILIDDQPVTPWWDDRVTTADGKMIWSFEPAPE
jgi:hypothetical protein